MNIQEALKELKKEEYKRNFDQSIDLIVNLRGIDLKRENVSAIVPIPNKIKDKKVCAFFNKKSDALTTITPAEFAKYKDKKEVNNLIKEFDFFIAAAPLMPQVATTFGKYLGPAGKMPTPQLGILLNENDAAIKSLLERIDKSFKVS